MALTTPNNPIKALAALPRGGPVDTARLREVGVSPALASHYVGAEIPILGTGVPRPHLQVVDQRPIHDTRRGIKHGILGLIGFDRLQGLVEVGNHLLRQDRSKGLGRSLWGHCLAHRRVHDVLAEF